MNTLIATFYAYKGGTGRTLALANVARYLAEELGYRVGLIDLDLESPGLVHEALSPALDPRNEQRQQVLDLLDAQPGFMECYLSRQANGEVEPQSIARHAFALSHERGGGIVLMPAARGSVYKTAAYNGEIAGFSAGLTSVGSANSAAELPTSVNRASEITWTILEDLSFQFDLDFLFIDGRTGAAPIFSPVYMYSVPHLMVMFCGLNEQNIQGTIATLQTEDGASTEEVPVMFVFSPVPTVGPANFEERLRFVTAQLVEAGNKRKPGVNYRYRLPSGVDHRLPYSDAAAFREVYFLGRYPNSELARAYRKLAHGIANLVVRPQEQREREAADARASTREPVRIALEGVHTDLFGKIGTVGISPEPYFSESRASPWERLLRFDGATPSDDFAKELPDILVLPQTHLQALAGRPGGDLLYSLNELKAKVGGGHRALDFEFLDSTYLNWRHWCSNEKALAGLPFSTNARLLCCDTPKLREICAYYWRERGQAGRGELDVDPFFLPSSWNAVSALLDAGIRHGLKSEEIFRFVGGARGLYFDWLNYVASKGGFDLIQSEGRLSQVVAVSRKETVDATRDFIDLAARAGSAKTMEELNDIFAKGLVAMYVGWTDSFRFAWDEGILTGISVAGAHAEASTDAVKPASDIRLGYVPRDMRFSRNTLVDGWLITVPKKQGDASHLSRALAFADTFLQPTEQRRLLREGFPSPSAWAVEQELDALQLQQLTADRCHEERAGISSSRKHAVQSFEVFLETMKLAIHAGKWVASAKTKQPIEKRVANILRKSWTDDRQVEGDLQRFAKTLERSARR